MRLDSTNCLNNQSLKGAMKKILLVLLLLSGCSSKPILPVKTPNSQRLSSLKAAVESNDSSFSPTDSSEEMAKLYLSGRMAEEKNDFKKACDLFEEISDEKSFPIHQAALLHTLKDCNYSASKLEDIWDETEIESYLKETYFELSLKLAIKNKIEVKAADFSYELSNFKQVQSEKVELLKNAIAIAEKYRLDEHKEKYFKRLTEVSPLFIKEVNETNIYAIARDYEANRLFEKARSLYREIIFTDKFESALRIKAYNSYRTSFKVERNLKEFLVKTGEMEGWLKNMVALNPEDLSLQEAWIDGKIAYARAVWTEHQNQEARKILEEALATKMGRPDQLATIYWVYGNLHIEVKENQLAIDKFQKANSFKPLEIALTENIQWAIIWNKYLLKKDTELLSDVDKYVAKSTNPNFTSKLNFWKAKSLMRLKKEEESSDLFRKTMNDDIFGYYGILSAMELEEELPALSPTEIDTSPSGFLTLDWLIAMNEDVYAEKYLKEIDFQFKTIAQREKAMSLYAQTKWFQGGMRQIYSFPLSKRNEYTEKFISVVFPTPYGSIINDFANKYNVPKELPFAITRQESAFNPNVRSWADAFGLMQMIPEKAEELSKKYNIPYIDFNDLYQPAPNLEMGTALLSELRTLFKSKFAQSVAAYNASTDVIAVWERERFNGNYLEFIEMIPYEETRNYIKLVFRNFITYKRVLNNEPVLVDKKFFEEPFN